MDYRNYMPPCDEEGCSNPQVRGSRFCIYCLDKKDPEKDKSSKGIKRPKEDDYIPYTFSVDRCKNPARNPTEPAGSQRDI